MALLFVDSVDHYDTGFLDQKWDRVHNATVVSGGRCSTNCIRLGTSSYVTKGVAASGATVVFGHALKAISDAGASGNQIATISAGATPLFDLTLNGDSSITGRYNPDAAFPSTSFVSYGGILPHDEFHYVEFKILLHTSAGSVDIQIDGVNVYSTSGIATLASGDPSTWTGIQFGGSSAFGGTSYLDDIYILDTSGAIRTDFLGDVRVEALEPISDGTTQEWDLGAGASHWSAVDDGAAPDEDTSYVSTSVLNEVEQNVHEDTALPVGSSIFGVQVTMLAKKDQPGDRTIAPVAYQSATVYVGSNLGITQDGYSFVHSIFEQNPDTTADWTVAEVNGGEWGVKVTN